MTDILPPTTAARSPAPESLPGQAHIPRTSAQIHEHSIVQLLKVTVEQKRTIQRLKDERRALMTAVRLDPETDTVPEAVAVCEALIAFYEEHTGR